MHLRQSIAHTLSQNYRRGPQKTLLPLQLPSRPLQLLPPRVVSAAAEAAAQQQMVLWSGWARCTSLLQQVLPQRALQLQQGLPQRVPQLNQRLLP